MNYFSIRSLQWISLLFLTSAIAMHGCDSDPFPVGESFQAGFQVPFVPTYTFNFRTGSEAISGELANLQIVSGADVQNLITATPGNLTQSEEGGVISGVVRNDEGIPVPNVAIGGTDKDGKILRDPEGLIVAGIKDVNGNIVTPLLYNGINGTPEFINTSGTATAGSFTVFNVSPGEYFIKAVQGGRGTGRVSSFPGSVSITQIEVFPVAIPTVRLTGRVRELDNLTGISQAEITFPGVGGALPSRDNGTYGGRGFGTDSRFLVKVSAVNHRDTFQELRTDFSQVQTGITELEITENITGVSIKDLQALADDGDLALPINRGIILGKVLEAGGRKSEAVVFARDRDGNPVGEIVYFMLDTTNDEIDDTRPVCNDPNPPRTACLNETTSNGRFLIVDLPPGDIFLSAHAIVNTSGGTGGKVKSSGNIVTAVFPDAISLATIIVDPIPKNDPESPDEVSSTVRVSGFIKEEDGTTSIGNAAIKILGVRTPSLSSNPDGSYAIPKGTLPRDTTRLLANSTYTVLVEDGGIHLPTYQWFRTGRGDLDKNFTMISNGTVAQTPGTGAITGQIINRRLGGRVNNIEIFATQMIDQNNAVVTSTQGVGTVQYFDVNATVINPALAVSSEGGRFLISGLPPGLIMLKTTSGDDSGNLIVHVFADSVTLADFPLNHVPLNVPASGIVTDLQDRPISNVTLSVLGEQASFSSTDFGSGILLPANGDFIIKATGESSLETFNYQLNTALINRPDQHLFITFQAELSGLAAKGGLSLDVAKGVIAGEVVERQVGKSPLSIPTNPSPRSLAAGFFNPDNFLDVAVVHIDGISILFGNENGGFDTASTSILVGTNPSAIAVGDFDQDGGFDLAVANEGDNSLSILFGDGKGQFTRRSDITFGIGTAPVFISAIDLNQDAKLDLLVANKVSNDVSVLFGDGDGNFSTFGNPCPDRDNENRCAVGTSPSAVTAGDFDEDGILDLAVADSGASQISILLSGGIRTTLATGAQPSAIQAGDFDGDDNIDLVVASAGESTITSFLGDGRGDFKNRRNTSLPPGSTPRGLLLLDFDQDQLKDLAVVNEGTGVVQILLGRIEEDMEKPNDPVSFSFSPPAKTFPVETGPGALISGDFNQDNQTDFAVVNSGSDTLSFLLSSEIPAEGVVLEARNFEGKKVGEVRYLNETRDQVADPAGNLLDRTSASGRFVVFNLPVGFVMLKSLPEASTKSFTGNALVTLFKPGSVSYTNLRVDVGTSLSVPVEGVSCRPEGDICSRVGKAVFSVMGTTKEEICAPKPDSTETDPPKQVCPITDSGDGSYKMKLDPHSEYVIRVIGPDVELPSDTDGDGLTDLQDNCPNIANPDQKDENANRIGDACELRIPDDDLDGIPNEEDNCRFTRNPDQLDTDEDGIGDVCDPTP